MYTYMHEVIIKSNLPATWNAGIQLAGYRLHTNYSLQNKLFRISLQIQMLQVHLTILIAPPFPRFFTSVITRTLSLPYFWQYLKATCQII